MPHQRFARTIRTIAASLSVALFLPTGSGASIEPATGADVHAVAVVGLKLGMTPAQTRAVLRRAGYTIDLVSHVACIDDWVQALRAKRAERVRCVATESWKKPKWNMLHIVYLEDYPHHPRVDRISALTWSMGGNSQAHDFARAVSAYGTPTAHFRSQRTGRVDVICERVSPSDPCVGYFGDGSRVRFPRYATTSELDRRIKRGAREPLATLSWYDNEVSLVDRQYIVSRAKAIESALQPFKIKGAVDSLGIGTRRFVDMLPDPPCVCHENRAR